MTEPDDDSAEKLLGRVAHAVCLGEAGFEELYHVYRPDLPANAITTAGLPKRNCKAGTDRWEALEREAAGRTIIGLETLNAANAIAERLMEHSLTRPLLAAAGEVEVSIVWEEQGVPCKARIDRFVSGVIALDLKTTRCAHESVFGRSVFAYGYHRQIAWYRRGFSRVYGTKAEATPFAIIAVETAPPFGVNVFQIDDTSLNVGMNDCERVLRHYAEARRTGVWPGYRTPHPETGELVEQVVTVGIPEWARREARVLVPNQEAGNESGIVENDDIFTPF
jgi:hypothetical protein